MVSQSIREKLVIYLETVIKTVEIVEYVKQNVAPMCLQINQAYTLRTK